jgi:hypothetical protein
LKALIRRRGLAACEVDAAKQQMGLRLIGREIQRAPQFGYRVGVASLLGQPPPAIQVERSQFLLVALPRRNGAVAPLDSSKSRARP